LGKPKRLLKFEVEKIARLGGHNEHRGRTGSGGLLKGKKKRPGDEGNTRVAGDKVHSKRVI